MLAGRKGAARHHGRESLSFLARRSPLILIGWLEKYACFLVQRLEF